MYEISQILIFFCRILKLEHRIDNKRLLLLLQKAFMRNSIILFIFVLICLPFCARNKNIDHLQKELIGTKNITKKIKILNDLAKEYQESDPKQMFIYAKKAVTLSPQTENLLLAGQAHQNIGVAYIIMGDYNKSLYYFTLAKDIFEKALRKKYTPNKKELEDGLARAYGSMGIVFSEQSCISKAHYYPKVYIFKTSEKPLFLFLEK